MSAKLGSPNISIIIFSHNRHALLERSFSHYGSSPYPVIVVDSSIKPFEGHIPKSIQYMHKPNERIGDRIYAALKVVETPYSITSADDDFLSFDALQEGYTFLRDNPDYTSVQGHYVHFEQSNPTAYLWPLYVPTIGHKNDNDDPKTRMHKALHAQHIYALFRTEDLKVCFRSIIGLNNTTNIELCTAIIGDILGKHKVIPKFWMARSVDRFTLPFENAQTSQTVVASLDKAYLSRPDGYAFVKGVARAIKNKGYSLRETHELIEIALESYEIRVSAIKKKSISKKIRKFIKLNLPHLITKQLRKVSARSFRNKVKHEAGFPWSDQQACKEWLKMIDVITKHQDCVELIIVDRK